MHLPENIREVKHSLPVQRTALAKNKRKGIEKGIRDKGPFI
jgi:hypothetical protein